MKINVTISSNNSDKKQPLKLKPVEIVPTKNAVSSKPGRSKADSIKSHSPIPSKTLMRRAVKKPQPSLKRKLRVYAAVYSQPQPAIDEITSLKTLATSPYHLAKPVKKSDKIKHFIRTEPAAYYATVKSTVQSIDNREDKANFKPLSEIRKPQLKRPQTMEDVLERAINHASSRIEPQSKLPKRKKFTRFWTAT